MMHEPQAVALPSIRGRRVPSTDEVLVVIDRVLREEVGLDRRVEPTTHFHKELALDSLGTFSLIVALEDHFRVTLPEEFAEEVQTVGDLAALIVKRAESEQVEVA